MCAATGLPFNISPDSYVCNKRGVVRLIKDMKHARREIGLARPEPSPREEEALGVLREASRNPHGTASERRDRLQAAWSSLRSAAAVSSTPRSKHGRKRKERVDGTPGSSQDPKVVLLLEGSQRGDSEQVTKLLREGVKVTAKDQQGFTALHLASLHGHVHVVRALLSAGAGDGSRIDRKSKSGNTALHFACTGNHAEVASMLCGYQADVYAANEYGQTPVSLGLRKLVSTVEERRRLDKIQATREQAPQLRLHSAGLEMGMESACMRDPEPGNGCASAGYLRRNTIALWESYQKEWAAFAVKFATAAAVPVQQVGPQDPEIRTTVFYYEDVPWPFRRIRLHGSGCDGIQDKSDLFLAHLPLAGKSMRSVVQLERLRWHPDKFAQMFGRRIAASEREVIMRTVQDVCQLINAIASETFGGERVPSSGF